ncbi:hypothetical protein [Aquimarina sp. I32.4]|uniref:hypothetical protein n=1 Tax=Aquimarina sp. I32.4 TaxID=2053903 RepID=UPI000CDF16EE|nr:hypothetical protein [Aquimarina sp. I32.4]
MKLHFYLFLLVFSSCNSAKNYTENNETCSFDKGIFKVENKELTLDINKYKTKLKRGRPYLEKGKEGYVNKIRILSSKNIIFDVIDEKKGILKSLRYDSIGKIKDITFLYEKENTPIFKEIIYKNGKITKTIDYEKGYNICWAEAISILKKIAKKDIKKYDINTFYLSRVDLNEFPNKKPKWRISMDGNEEYSDRDTKFYEIDGVTGEFIRAYEVETIYDD